MVHFQFLLCSCQKMSLDALAKKILGITLDKFKGIRCSNWEDEKLSTQQVDYAMNDAVVAIHIFLTLVREKIKQRIHVVDDFSPGEKNFSFRDVHNEDLANGLGYYETTVDLLKFESDEMERYFSRDEVINLISDPYFAQSAGLLCQGLIDVAFKARKRKVVSNDKHSISSDPEKLQKPSKNGTVRKSPLYKNCVLTAPDGSRLCTLDRKKADWYIDKALGKVCLDCVFS